MAAQVARFDRITVDTMT